MKTYHVIITVAAAACLASCGNISDSSAETTAPAVTTSVTTTTTTAATTTTATTTTTAAAETVPETEVSADEEEYPQLLSSPEDIGLYSTDGGDMYYAFTYGGEYFDAVYTEDNWKIIDSYRVQNNEDMVFICTALADVHQIHTSDYSGYRTPEDMAYEWLQHNLAYYALPDDAAWKQNAKDVDINPEDQGKTLFDFYLERSGTSFGE